MTANGRPAAPARRPRLAVIFSRFPVWNQTFALADLGSLSRAGFDIDVFALLGGRGTVEQREARAFEGRVVRASLTSWTVVRDVVTAMRRPLAWRILRRLVGATATQPVELAKSFVLFTHAVHFAAAARRRGIQHVHAGWASYPATAAWIVSELTGIPFSFSAHAYDIYKVQTLLPEKIAHARFVVTCAETNRRALLEIAGDAHAGKMHVHRHGVDLALFRPVGNGRPAGGTWRLLACGVLAPYKGYDVLLTACEALKRRGHAFTCTIIGEGPEHARLSARIKDAGLSAQVRIRPPVPQAELARHYRHADVFVHPSVVMRDGNRDVIPNVMVEAMASGVPVVSTRLAGIEELIRDGENGVLIAPGDAERLADAIAALMQDPRRRARLADAGKRAVADGYDRRANARDLVQTFRTHVDRTPTGAGALAGQCS